MRKIITNQREWGSVRLELENEYDKLQSYDLTILDILGDIKGLKILDYGSGPGVMANLLKGKGGNVRVYDISKEMRELAAEKLGRNMVFDTDKSIPDNFFDIILCNLVVCIITEEDVQKLLFTIARKLNKKGRIFIGFCNPQIFTIKETKLDYRFPVDKEYECIHEYKKIKKEGNYEIVEKHRPIEWYKKQIKDADLKVEETIFTPEYEMNGDKINDFIIFELGKE